MTREVGDPRIGFVTITDVETSPDLRHAQVWVSVIGQPAERDAPSPPSVGRCHSCGASLAGGSGSSASRTFTFASTTPPSAAPVSSSSCTSSRRGGGGAERAAPASPANPGRAAAPRGRPTDEPPSAAVPPAPTARRRRPDRQRKSSSRTHDERRPRRVPGCGADRSSNGCEARGGCWPSAMRTRMRTRSARPSPWHDRGCLRRSGRPRLHRPGSRALWLPGGHRAVPHGPDPDADYDLLVISDCGTLDQVGAVRDRHAELFERLPRVVLDHHASNDDERHPAGLGRSRRGRHVRDGDTPRRSTRRTARHRRGSLAAALMAGIVMDTATFAHPNATPRTLVVSAALVEAGAPLSDISRRLYRSKPERQLKLFGRVLDRLVASEDGRIVVHAGDATSPPRAASVPSPRGSSTCSRRRRPQRWRSSSSGPAGTRLSVRTKPGGVDATVLTGRFGGGGHARAAGATVELPRTRRVPSCSPKRPAWPPPSRAERGPRVARPGFDGILVVAKPPGPTSHDVVALVRRLAATKRVGHGGTLDPFAAGVLPVFLGKATRWSSSIWAIASAIAPRCASVRRRRRTTSRGSDAGRGTGPDRAAIEAAPRLTGTIRQRPPHSAIKLDGRRAYAIARAGGTVDLAEREVTIHRLDLLSWDDSDRPARGDPRRRVLGRNLRPRARPRPRRVSGQRRLTSVRLTRTASGPFTLDDAVALDEVREAAAGGPEGQAAAAPVDTGLDAFPEVRLTEVEVAAIARGQFVRPEPGIPSRAERYRLVGPAHAGCDRRGPGRSAGATRCSSTRPDAPE